MYVMYVYSMYTAIDTMYSNGEDLIRLLYIINGNIQFISSFRSKLTKAANISINQGEQHTSPPLLGVTDGDRDNDKNVPSRLKLSHLKGTGKKQRKNVKNLSCCQESNPGPLASATSALTTELRQPSTSKRPSHLT